MARNVSIRELRNSTAAVVSDLEAGERLTLTVNRRPVADILTHVEDRNPWVPAAELRRIVREAPADSGLLDDLAEIRDAEIDDARAERLPTPRYSSPRRPAANWARSPRRSRSQ
jgi:antitoxin (DNA-binding transcriptional repressor) of toxin-antitoxin stability system